MGEPVISVIMPVYNAERYVGEAVRSILGQTRGDFELIIVDDGSTDGSGAILRGLAGKDGRIQLVSRANTGLTRALNEAAGLARGEFLARMDADDVAMAERLARQVEYMEGHGDCVAVGGAAACMTAEGWEIDTWLPPGEHEEIDRLHIEGLGTGLAHPAVLMRREAFERAGGYRAECEPAEDLDLWLRLAEGGGRLGNVREVVLRYRMHVGSVLMVRRRAQWERTWEVIGAARARRGLAAIVPAAWGGDADVAERTRRMWVGRALLAGHYGTARRVAWQNLWEAGVSGRAMVMVAAGLLGPVGRGVLRWRGGS